MRLVNHVAVLFNTLQDKQPSQVKSGLHPMNCLLLIDSGEAFGLVSSPHTASYGGLLEIKDEITSTPETDLFLQELDAHHGAAEMRWQPVVESNSDSDDETNLHVTDCQCTKPSSGLVRVNSSTRKGKRKALETLSIETSPDPLNVPARAASVDKRRRLQLDQPHVPTESSMSWLHSGDDLPVRNHI